MPKSTHAPWWFRAISALIDPWLRLKIDSTNENYSSAPRLYVLERGGVTDDLILDKACALISAPCPTKPTTIWGTRRRNAILSLALRKRAGRPKHHESNQAQVLVKLLETLKANPRLEIQIIPVSIFVGRAPDRDSGWFKVLFTENWAVVGRLRRLFAIVLNGRDTIVRFSPAISLQDALTDGNNTARTSRKILRVLRSHFRRQRALVIGPDLSHRRTLIDAVVNAAPVQSAIDLHARKAGTDRRSATARAREFAWEIAADQSHLVIRSASFLMQGLWSKIYNEIRTHNLDRLREIAPGHEVIYVPCHRSTIDDALLPHLLYVNGLATPHIGAGVNLNLPILGPLLRRGGAFFLRRSFRDSFYSTVFREYLSQLFARGVSLMYFIEGTRSRTGRMLSPRGGLLSMTVRSYLRESRRPVVFQPVYIGYEKIIEGEAYALELSGHPKKSESLIGLIRSLGVLRHNYGSVTVNFGHPLFLSTILDEIEPKWRTSSNNLEEKPVWLRRAVDTLADRINININSAADVNPVCLIATILLSTPRHAISELDLIAQINLYKDALNELPYSDTFSFTQLNAQEVINYSKSMQLVIRTPHPLGDIISCDEKQASHLSYFRNNVLHLFVPAAWVACCFENNRRISKGTIEHLGVMIYPFLKAEFFLPWSQQEFANRINAAINFFIRARILTDDHGTDWIQRGQGQEDGTFQLQIFAQPLLQIIERYFITIAALNRSGQNSITGTELENLILLVAQRLSILYQFRSFGTFDKASLNGFIRVMRERGLIWTGAAGTLEFKAELPDWLNGAKVILRREVRDAIFKLMPESLNACAQPTNETGIPPEAPL